MHYNQLDLNEEMLIQRIGQGVQLIRPEMANTSNQLVSIGNLSSMPFHMYFMDRDSIVKKTNDRTARTFNLASASDVIGKTARDVSKKESAELSIMNDKFIVDKNAMHVSDLLYTRLDGVSYPLIDIKFPWYANHKLIGVFGFSILLDEQQGVPLAQSMLLLVQTGLLQSCAFKSGFLPGLAGENIYFTQRQKDILFYIIRGKTARDIAKILNLSPRTVEHHINNMKTITHSRSKSELIEKITQNLF